MPSASWDCLFISCNKRQTYISFTGVQMATLKRLNTTLGKFPVVITSMGILSTCYSVSVPSAEGKEHKYDTASEILKENRAVT